MAIGYKEQTSASVPTPASGSQYTFIDSSDHKMKRKSSDGSVLPLEYQSVALTDGASINTDANLGSVFTVTLGGNRTLENPINGYDGQSILYRIRQDGTGSRLLSYGSAFRFGSDITGATISTAASKTDYLEAIYNSTDSKWDVVRFVKGY